jgi:ketosteroid isomerase-like protein
VAETVAVETFEVLDIIVQGDRAAVVARITARLRTNGLPLAAEKADILRVRDGKIVRFTEYYDTGLVARTLAAPAEEQRPA